MGELNMRECPFCGCDAWIIEDRGDNGSEPLLYRPQCKMCGGGLGGFQFRDNAITAWNTRPRTEGRGEGKPVAWAYEYTNHLKGDRAPGGWLRAVAFEAPARARVNAGFARNVQPLFASPIREPEISRTALIAALDAKLAEVGGAFLSNDQAADAILNLAPVGGRGEEGSARADLSPASRSPEQHSDGGEARVYWAIRRIPDGYVETQLYKFKHTAEAAASKRRRYQAFPLVPQEQGGMK